MGTKNISLPPDLEEYVDAKVESGEYAHASEVVRDGIRLLMKHEAEKLEWLRNAIAVGRASADRGDLLSEDQVGEEINKQAQKLMRARQKAQRR